MIFRLPAYVDPRGDAEKSAYNWMHTRRARARRWLARPFARLRAGVHEYYNPGGITWRTVS